MKGTTNLFDLDDFLNYRSSNYLSSTVLEFSERNIGFFNDDSDYKSSFNTLLAKNGSCSIHHRNIQSLAIEICKFLHGLSPAIMGDIIKLNRPPTYNLRTHQELYSRNPKTVRYGTETISFLAPINIRKWKPDCPCRLCKCFLKNVGFI